MWFKPILLGFLIVYLAILVRAGLVDRAWDAEWDKAYNAGYVEGYDNAAGSGDPFQ